MSKHHKKSSSDAKNSDDGSGAPSKHGTPSASGPRQWHEEQWIRDGNGRFAGSVKQTKPFTDQERIELQDYKEGNYQQLNAYLRDPASVRESLGKELDKQIKTIDAAIGKSVLQQEMVVYRGIQHPALARNAERLVGRSIDAPTYLSTSAHSGVARNFASTGSGGVVLAIRARAGTHAAYLDQFQTSGNSGESELLFGRNSRVRITGVDRTRRPPVITGEFE
jgi:hypothetical protein